MVGLSRRQSEASIASPLDVRRGLRRHAEPHAAVILNRRQLCRISSDTMSFMLYPIHPDAVRMAVRFRV